MKKIILAGFLLAAGTAVHAQAAGTNAASATTAGASKVSAAKQQLIEKILKLQQPSIELLARTMVEAPASQMGQQASLMLRRLPQEKRESVGKGMQADLEKYINETVPLVREKSIALAPSTVGTVLDEKFSEAELKEVIALLESPIHRKFLEHSFAMQRALHEKLVAETRSTVEPKLKALDQSWGKRFKDAAPAATEKTAPPAPTAPGPTAK